MPRNSSGSYVLPAGNPVVSDTLIKTSWANPTMSDIAAALSDSLDRYGRGGMLAEFKVTDGTVQAPGLAFIGQSNLGLFREDSNMLSIATAGSAAAKFSNVAVQLTRPTSMPSATMTGAVTVGNGSAAAPTVLFAGDNDTGFFSPAPGVVAVATQGVERMRWDDQGNVTNTVPVGTVLDFAGSTPPQGYLICDGSAVSRTTYAALFAAIGTTWGAGDGGTTFNLPDLRRRTTIGAGGNVISGVGNVLGSVGGEEANTLAVANIPSHTHSITDAAHQHGAHVEGNTGQMSADHTHSGWTDAQGQHQHISGVPHDAGSFYGMPDMGGYQSGKGGNVNYRTSTWTSADGSHSHNVGTGGASANHTHFYAVDIATDWRWSGINGTNATGSGSAFNNMQPTAVLNKIIRV